MQPHSSPWPKNRQTPGRGSNTTASNNIHIRPVSTRKDERAFIQFAKDLFAGTPQWVPPMDLDLRSYLRRKHPYFEHSDAEFLLAYSGDTVVGRGAVMVNDLYNQEHNVQAAHFYFVEFRDDREVSSALFAALSRWADKKGMATLIGPLFSGGTMGGGVLVEGYEHRAAMTMMPYNHAYYPEHYEAAGFTKRFDLFSLTVDPERFALPDRIQAIAERVRERGRIEVVPIRTRRDLKRLAGELAALYNPTIGDHTENYPLTEKELKALTSDLLLIARPDLETVIRYHGEIVGFIFSFPDLSEALIRNAGKLGLFRILRLLRARKTATKILFNGMGILEKYQRLGGNALLYSQLVNAVTAGGKLTFDEVEMVQINESTELMLRDMQTVGARPFKLHRVYHRALV